LTVAMHDVYLEINTQNQDLPESLFLCILLSSRYTLSNPENISLGDITAHWSLFSLAGTPSNL